MQVESRRIGLQCVLEFARRYLRLDLAYVAELTGESLVFRAVAGDASSFGIAVGESVVVEGTYLHRLAAGEIPSAIGDVMGDERVADLPITRAMRIGSYLGVPVRLPDGSLYGTLGCLGHEPTEHITEREVRLLSMLGEAIAADLDQLRRADELTRRLRALLGGEALGLAYQPIVDLCSGRVLGLEALARFPEPFEGPERTFAAAESVGLGLELERLVVRQAWTMLEGLAAGQFLAVNVSPAALLELARGANREQQLALSRLVVEITEHSAVQAYAALRGELAPLRERGLRIAVDDAGGGYASLRHILELRPDFIKLDRWLIDGLAEDPARRVAVSAFVSLARELGSTVIAEGVERAADLAAVRELGLDAAQGYLLGRPTTDHDAVLAWCAATRALALEPAATENPARAGQPAAESDHAPFETPVSLDDAIGSGDRSSRWAPGGSDRARRPPGAAVPDLAGPQRRALAGELERLELDRRVSQRLEAVGQLAAGIAHEINTPLQFVGDSVTFLKDAVDELLALTDLYRETLHGDAPIPVSERRQAMREAEERADVEYLCERIPAAFTRTGEGIARVRSIVQAMKRFSHATSSEAAPADINEAIETTLVVCRNEYKYIADVALELGEIPPVTCNIGELNQVFLNLIINAAQAIEEKVADSGGRGQIRICTRVEEAAVVIEIADDGPGIPPALLDRIYEPFFTTKEVGKGTGQGLALARATIERHAGALDCASTLGAGTTFSIRLPLQPAGGEMAAAA